MAPVPLSVGVSGLLFLEVGLLTLLAYSCTIRANHSRDSRKQRTDSRESICVAFFSGTPKATMY